MTRFASIDIGSQTIRLLVAECGQEDKLSPVYRARSIVRLGEGMNEKKLLTQQAVDRAVTCIAEFVKTAKKYNVSKIFPVATACVRNAQNAHEFLEKVSQQTGLMPAVVSGKEEARLSLRGVQSVCDSAGITSLVIDIGGGSTEITLTRETSPCMIKSLPLGVIGLAEKYLTRDPPHSHDIEALQEHVQEVLQAQRDIVDARKDHPGLIGTAGTITTLAAMDMHMKDYEPDKINGHLLTLKNIKGLLKKMASMPAENRSRLPGLEPGRAVVIIPGTVIVLAVMGIFNAEEMVVSDAGLLEGVLLKKIDEGNWESL